MSFGRPPIGIGHVTLHVTDVAKSESFYRALGMRPILARETMAILELRGGTHLLLFHTKETTHGGPVRAFDLMVDDIPDFRDRVSNAGIEASAVERDDRGGHLFFTVTDPDGHLLTVYSSHAGGREV